MKVTIPYKPRYPEAHALLERCRFTCIVGHRRFGKTVLSVNHLIKQALSCRKINGHFAYVAPFRHQAKTAAWKYLKHFTRPIPGVKVNESELSVTLPSPGGAASIRIFGADNPDALRGAYYDGVVLDEVAQMKAEVWEETIQPALADREGFAVFIGTPKGINLFSKIYHYAVAEQAAGNPLWGAACYPCDKTGALPRQEIERLRAELTDAKFRQEMLCDFTASSDDVLISVDEANAAFSRSCDAGLASRWPLVIGVDVARFGADATVFFARRGQIAMQPKVMRGLSNTDVANRLAAHIEESGATIVNIDQGQGTGVIDMLQGLLSGSGITINEVPFGSRALNPDKYFNRRAEMWLKLRDWLRAGGSLPAGEWREALLAELTAPAFSYAPSGAMKLEAKEEIKKRLSRSTDLGDALALTFAVPLAPLSEGGQRKNYRQNRYNPFRKI